MQRSRLRLLYVAGSGRNRPDWARPMRPPQPSTTGSREGQGEITALGGLETPGLTKGQWVLPSPLSAHLLPQV